LLSATHRNLAELVALGQFREDLYYRINVIELRVPALRERSEDIPELAEHILTRLARRGGVAVPVLSSQALQLLREYSFPGNVRELENILERAMTLCAEGEIHAADLQLRAPTIAPHAPASAGVRPIADVIAEGSALGSQLEDVERAAIIRALEQNRYNKTAAAKQLGMTFRALRYRIKKLGIE
jgi:two-component system, NtrC family, response regulator PilR